MRTHDGNERDENHRWDADAETVTHFRAFARVTRPSARAARPRRRGRGDRHAHRPPPHAGAPDDENTWGISDQFLLGPDLLVAPITAEGTTRREVYFPAGEWFNVWDGGQVTGPGWETVDGPVGAPPVYARGADRTDLRALLASE